MNRAAKSWLPCAAILLAASAPPAHCFAQPSGQTSPSASFDVVITHGHIIDGTGSPWYSGDVGIRDGRIAAIGNLEAAPRKRTIDAHGDVVAPGFIDMLGQSEMTMLVDPRLPSKIYQGITTEITGEGSSIAPLNDAILQADHVTWEHYGVRPTWPTFGGYFARLRQQGIGINLASYVGATQVRRMVLGDDDRAPGATFNRPNQLAEGMRFVLVNGVPVIAEGRMTNALPGKVLTR